MASYSELLNDAISEELQRGDPPPSSFANGYPPKLYLSSFRNIENLPTTVEDAAIEKASSIPLCSENVFFEVFGSPRIAENGSAWYPHLFELVQEILGRNVQSIRVLASREFMPSPSACVTPTPTRGYGTPNHESAERNREMNSEDQPQASMNSAEHQFIFVHCTVPKWESHHRNSGEDSGTIPTSSTHRRAAGGSSSSANTKSILLILRSSALLVPSHQTMSSYLTVACELHALNSRYAPDHTTGGSGTNGYQSPFQNRSTNSCVSSTVNGIPSAAAASVVPHSEIPEHWAAICNFDSIVSVTIVKDHPAGGFAGYKTAADPHQSSPVLPSEFRYPDPATAEQWKKLLKIQYRVGFDVDARPWNSMEFRFISLPAFEQLYRVDPSIIECGLGSWLYFFSVQSRMKSASRIPRVVMEYQPVREMWLGVLPALVEDEAFQVKWAGTVQDESVRMQHQQIVNEEMALLDTLKMQKERLQRKLGRRNGEF